MKDRKLINFTDVGGAWGQQVIMSSSHKWPPCSASHLLLVSVSSESISFKLSLIY